MFSKAFVSFFACLYVLSVSNITQKALNGLQRNFMGGFAVVKETTDLILAEIRIFIDE